MLRAVMKKVNDMQEYMSNVRRQIQTPRKNQKETLEIKKDCDKMKNIFDGLINRLYVAGKRNCELDKYANRNFQH